MKLTTKISLVLIIIVLVTGIFISAFSLGATRSFFGEYIFAVREGQLIQWENAFEEYYKTYGGWQNLESARLYGGQMRGFGMGKGMGMGRQGVVLVDTQGKVLFNDSGMSLDSSLIKDRIKSGRPLKINNEIVGYLFPAEVFIEKTRTLEQKFINSVLNSVIMGTAIASFLAILLGLWWSRRLTKPLEALALASQGVAKGQFDKKVEVLSKDELGSVASAFNVMAEELEKNHRLREQLFADISHELRTPLTILKSGFETHLENVDNKITPEKLSSLYDEIIRLQSLVNELQNLAKLEAGQIKLAISRINIKDFTEDLKILLDAEAQARGIIFSIKVDPEILFINADQDRLKQILLNLINNAFNNTAIDGKITLEILAEFDNITIVVSDNGKGIPENDLPYVFQRFYRTDKSRNRATGGTGLGLAIVKGYVEAHNGSITAESQENIGTKFTIKLPIRS